MIGQDPRMLLNQYAQSSPRPGYDELISGKGLIADAVYSNMFGLHERLRYGGLKSNLQRANEALTDRLRERATARAWMETGATSSLRDRQIRTSGWHASMVRGGGYGVRPRADLVRQARIGTDREILARSEKHFSQLKKNRMGVLERNSQRIKSIERHGKMWHRTGLLMFGAFAVEAGFSITKEAMRKQLASNFQEEWNSTGPPMLDTERTYTGRQRALAAIHNSQLHARAVIGNEAQYLHM